MRLAIVTNSLDAQDAGESNFHVAAVAAASGHEVWMTTVGGLEIIPDGAPRLRARAVRPECCGDAVRALAAVREGTSEWLDADRFDAILLRNNPFVQHAWARDVALRFGAICERRGVVVWNEPRGLFRAADKLYLLELPREVRPATLVTRDRAEIEAFLEKHREVVLKPLGGSGGRDVFLVRTGSTRNLETIARTISRAGFIVAQEYVPEAMAGDTRLILLEGEPISVGGRIAAVRRVRGGDDLRSNIHAGGSVARAEVTEGMLAVARAVGPRLIADGLHLAGLDLAGDRLLEVNVFAPGGLRTASELEGVDFIAPAIAALERAVSRGAPGWRGG